MVLICPAKRRPPSSILGVTDIALQLEVPGGYGLPSKVDRLTIHLVTRPFDDFPSVKIHFYILSDFLPADTQVAIGEGSNSHIS